MTKLRVLIAFEDAYRLYGETIAGAIEAMRPRVEVATTEVRALETEARGFEPHVIISSLPYGAANLDGFVAWVQIPSLPPQPIKIWTERRQWQASDSPTDEILSVVDEVEKLVRNQAP